MKFIGFLEKLRRLIAKPSLIAKSMHSSLDNSIEDQINKMIIQDHLKDFDYYIDEAIQFQKDYEAIKTENEWLKATISVMEKQQHPLIEVTNIYSTEERLKQLEVKYNQQQMKIRNIISSIESRSNSVL